ncbi:hypothetical protein L2E82_27608 [Cichorium intybus]|uniref:Uncharacterized protein n=1 Tax=Cichorium intybus TaxID=13427 RepID=A0ACB9CTR9_CICIN|nr:hypothetical protein L2E82_27608 [Cichorium intybus]
MQVDTLKLMYVILYSQAETCNIVRQSPLTNFSIELTSTSTFLSSSAYLSSSTDLGQSQVENKEKELKDQVCH